MHVFSAPPGQPRARRATDVLLLVPALLGLALLARRERVLLWVPIAIAAVLVVVGEMPQGNEYKMARLLGLVLALPAGVWIASLRGRALRAVCVLGFATLPTTLAVARAYLVYGERVQFPAVPPIPAAEREADARAVVVCDAPEELLRATRGLVQGNPLAPFLHHPLFVDSPQIHNERQPDLAERLEDQRESALERMRARLPTRPFLFLWPGAPLLERLRAAGARELGPDTWLLPALRAGE